MQQRCTGTSKSGAACRARALPGSAYCIAHDPKRVVDMAAYRRKGGKARSNRARAKKSLPAEPLTAEEVRSYLGVVFKGVIAGKMEPNIGTAAANIARALMDVGRAAEVEEQIAQLRRDMAAFAERRDAS